MNAVRIRQDQRKQAQKIKERALEISEMRESAHRKTGNEHDWKRRASKQFLEEGR
jgi:hypothetical protein